MNSMGEAIRNLQIGKQLPLRTVAGCLDIDQAILSRIEAKHKTFYLFASLFLKNRLASTTLQRNLLPIRREINNAG